MKNNFLTIARAAITADADTESLLTRLRIYPELILVHLFAHESMILLFIEIKALHEFLSVQQRLGEEPGIADCFYRHLSPAVQTPTIPTYEPKTWLL